jgi:small-conductance mechanosensitive channel
MLESPHLSSAAKASFSLINYERNLVLACYLFKLSEVVRCGNVVFESRNWLDNNSTYILSTVSSLLNDISHCLETSVFFSSVLMLESRHRVLDSRERSSGPVKGRH